MLGFRKMDEMEQLIALKSLKIAYGFTVLCLFIWCIFDTINKNTSCIALMLLITQNLVLIFSQMYFKRKMGCK